MNIFCIIEHKSINSWIEQKRINSWILSVCARDMWRDAYIFSLLYKLWTCFWSFLSCTPYIYVRRCAPKMFTIFSKLRNLSKFMNFLEVSEYFLKLHTCFLELINKFSFWVGKYLLKFVKNFWNSETHFCTNIFEFINTFLNQWTFFKIVAFSFV